MREEFVSFFFVNAHHFAFVWLKGERDIYRRGLLKARLMMNIAETESVQHLSCVYNTSY